MLPIASPPGSRIAPISLTRGQSVVLGRARQSDIRLADDRSVSGRHLQVSCDGETVVLRDLGSRNGTRVNGERTLQARLRHNDQFQLGAYVFRVQLSAEIDEAADFPTTDFDSLELSDIGYPPEENETVEPEAERVELDRVCAGLLRLKYELPGETGKTITLASGQAVTVGRGTMADYEVDCRSLSLIHFRLRHHEGTATVEDCRSQNGTLLNGQKIESAELRNGDTIAAGSMTFQVQLAEPFATSPAPTSATNGSSGAPLKVPERKVVRAGDRPDTKQKVAPKKILATSRQEFGTGLIAFEGQLADADLPSLVALCESVLGGFRLLVDFQRLGEDVPVTLDQQAKSLTRWFGPIEKETATSVLIEYNSGAEAASAWEEWLNVDSALGIATATPVAELAEKLQQVGGVWALGWPALVRTMCESGAPEIIDAVFESLTAIVVEGDHDGEWNLYLRPETESKVSEWIEVAQPGVGVR